MAILFTTTSSTPKPLKPNTATTSAIVPSSSNSKLPLKPPNQIKPNPAVKAFVASSCSSKHLENYPNYLNPKTNTTPNAPNVTPIKSPTFTSTTHSNPLQHLTTTLTAFVASSCILFSPALTLADISNNNFILYYGTAASAANYGGYGGNADKRAVAEYTYLVPSGWKERLVSKVEKGTNGTDSEFYNPKKRSEREYLTFLAGFRSLAPIDAVLDNLALSDVNLQDQIATADGVKSSQTKDEKGQLYYTYEIDGAGAHSLISVTCARNKLYSHFVTAPNAEWSKDEEMLRTLHRSFKTVDPTDTNAGTTKNSS